MDSQDVGFSYTVFFTMFAAIQNGGQILPMRGRSCMQNMVNCKYSRQTGLIVNKFLNLFYNKLQTGINTTEHNIVLSVTDRVQVTCVDSSLRCNNIYIYCLVMHVNRQITVRNKVFSLVGKNFCCDEIPFETFLIIIR